MLKRLFSRMKGFKDMAIGTLDIDRKLVVEAVLSIVQAQSLKTKSGFILSKEKSIFTQNIVNFQLKNNEILILEL